LPVVFDRNQPSPKEWINFLNSIWPDDAQSIQVLQEMCGLLLTPITKFQKIFLLVGPKRSGKGTILRILRALIGPDNIAAPTLDSLAKEFGLQPLIGKLAALIGDARLGGQTNVAIVVERLLSISGEDTIGVARKHTTTWVGSLPVRFVLSTNELPRLTDASGAIASRFVVLVMEQSFFGREDLELEAKLLRELPGILNWALAGRRRLLERGYFEQPKSAAEAVEQLNDLGSPIKAFVRDCCKVGPDEVVVIDDLFAAWRTWCSGDNRHAGAKGTFGRDLRAALPSVKMFQSRAHGMRRVYGGIGLLSPPPGAPTEARVQALGLGRQSVAVAPTPPVPNGPPSR
jgi:putative DNA primase/helicase